MKAKGRNCDEHALLDVDAIISHIFITRSLNSVNNKVIY